MQPPQAGSMGWEELHTGGTSPTLFLWSLLLHHCGSCWNKAEGGQSVLVFLFKPQDSVPGVLSGEEWESQALVCCVELPSETRQKIGEERPPSEHGASGLASAHSSRLFSSTHYGAAPCFSLSFSSSPVLHPTPGHLNKLLLISKRSSLALCKANSFLNAVPRFPLQNPKYTFSLIPVTSRFYLLHCINHKS